MEQDSIENKYSKAEFKNSGSKYLESTLETFDNITSRSQFEEYYKREGKEQPSQWRPEEHSGSLPSFSDDETYKQIEEEIKLHKELGIGRYSKRIPRWKGKREEGEVVVAKSKRMPEGKLENDVEIAFNDAISSGDEETQYEVKAEFIPDDTCSIGYEILHGTPDRSSQSSEPSICGSLYADHLINKDGLASSTSSISASSAKIPDCTSSE